MSDESEVQVDEATMLLESQAEDGLRGLLNEQLEGDSDIGIVDGETPQAPPSNTVFDLDSWSVRKGEELFAESPAIQNAFSDLVNPEGLTDTTGKKPNWLDTADQKVVRDAEAATADFRAAAFEPEPEFAKNPKNERIARYMKNLMGTPEFKELHAETCMDEEASELAAVSFAKQWVQVAITQEPKSDLQKDMQCNKAARDALRAAASDVGEWNDMKDAMGHGNAGEASRLSKEELRKRFQNIRKSTYLRRVMQLAGRYRRLAQTMQRKKTLHGQDETVGVTLGGDVSKLLPTELGMLADPDLETLEMLKIAESAAMIRDYRGIEKVGKGPIVVVVDESGSMNGEPICQAKAYALAMYWIAKQQKRWCCLVGYSGSEDGNFLVLPPGVDKSKELFDWLEHFFSGGTDMDVPLVELPRRWKEQGTPEGRTDIINITDAYCHVPDHVAASFNEWKKQMQARYNVIVVGDSGDSLKSVADRIWSVKQFDAGVEEIGESLMSV